MNQLKAFLPLISITLLTSALLLTGYYFTSIKPKLELERKTTQTQKILRTHLDNLVQNRISYVELVRLKPDSTNLQSQVSNLTVSINQTNQKGLELLEKENQIPQLNQEINQRFPSLLEETKEIYQNQAQILVEVFQTDSYQEGLPILQSQKSINLLTDQTNLILNYQFHLQKLNP